MIDLHEKLTENFTLSEFIISQVAERKGIDNTPSTQIINNLKRLCVQILEPARHSLGQIIISSGYRSPKLNLAVGGSITSSHDEGFCADCTPVKVSKLEFAKWVVKNCDFDQVILEYGTKNEAAWIHVSADPRRRKQVLRILLGGKYEPIVL